jgi:hypothetical protein
VAFLFKSTELKSIVVAFLLFFFIPCTVLAQGFSLGTDISVLRNNSARSFWSVGQSLIATAELRPKTAAYLNFTYFLPGKFTSSWNAQAKSPSTTPQQVPFDVRSEWKYRLVTAGIKQYFNGSYVSDQGWSFYGLAGVGLALTRIDNSRSVSIDTAAYFAPGAAGSQNYSHLSIDLGFGAEWPLAESIYFYTHLRTWINTKKIPEEVANGASSSTPIYASFGLRFSFFSRD